MSYGRRSTWAVCSRPRPAARLRLFCFPYAGGGSGVYRGWEDALPEPIEVWPVLLPGRERRIADPPVNNILQLAEAAAAGLEELLHGPFAFFGHSMGALLGFELTRRLQREGRDGPICLAVSGLGAPHLATVRAPTAHLPEPEFIQELRRLKGTPPGVLDNPELIELLLPMLRADFLAVETYRFVEDGPLACPIFAYGGSTDVEVPPDHLEQWAIHTSREHAVTVFEGDHFYLQSRMAVLTAALASDLLRVADGRSAFTSTRSPGS